MEKQSADKAFHAISSSGRIALSDETHSRTVSFCMKGHISISFRGEQDSPCYTTHTSTTLVAASTLLYSMKATKKNTSTIIVGLLRFSRCHHPAKVERVF
jgi:hypothetical protein